MAHSKLAIIELFLAISLQKICNIHRPPDATRSSVDSES